MSTFYSDDQNVMRLLGLFLSHTIGKNLSVVPDGCDEDEYIEFTSVVTDNTKGK